MTGDAGAALLIAMLVIVCGLLYLLAEWIRNRKDDDDDWFS